MSNVVWVDQVGSIARSRVLFDTNIWIMIEGFNEGGYCIRMTIGNEISKTGVAVAHTKGWESTHGDRTDLPVLKSDVDFEEGVRVDKPMQDVHFSAAMNVKMGGIKYEALMHGVFDGHGRQGEKASAWMRDETPRRVQHRLQQFNPVGWDDEDVYAAFKVAMPDVSRSFHLKTGGSTANVSIAFGNDLWVLNVGDSELLIVKPDGYTQANEAANVSKKGNRFSKSIAQRGAYVDYDNRIEGRLNVARAMGDNMYKGRISPRPKITRFVRPDDEQWYLVHMTDGMTCAASPKQVAGFVGSRVREGASLEKIAVELVAAAALAGSDDNITVQIVPFPDDPAKVSQAGPVEQAEIQPAA